MRYIEVKSSLKDKLLFLFFSILREELISNNFYEENKFLKENIKVEEVREVKIEDIPFFECNTKPVKSRIR